MAPNKCPNCGNFHICRDESEQWIPATTLPTAEGKYVVRRWFGSVMGSPASEVFVVVDFRGKWEFDDITHYISKPLPPIPANVE